MDLGEVSMNLLVYYPVWIGAHNQLARTVLARILSIHAVPLSWGIGCDISTKRYGIIIHPVVRDQASALTSFSSSVTRPADANIHSRERDRY